MRLTNDQAAPRKTLKRPRQEPVSCTFCRSKKLKCNRRHPCSNCSARGVECDSQTHYPVEATSTPTSGTDNSASVLARLQRLEEVVLGSRQDVPSTTSTNNISPSQAPDTEHPSNTWVSPESKYDEEVQTLEEVGFGEYPAHSVTAQQVSVAYNISETLLSKVSRQKSGSTVVSLPPKELAFPMLDHYLSYMNEFQHILYVPAVRAMAEALYSNLDRGVTVVHSHVALLFSMFASTAALHSTSASEITQTLFAEVHTMQASSIWAYTALEVLEFSRYTTSGSLEDIQTSIILGFLLYHIEGFSARPRALFSTAIIIARDVSLHKIDLPTNRTTPKDQASFIDTEIRRRVWWYLASTDWLLSLSGGPQEGTYSIQPRQMHVNRPRNVNDEDLIYNDPPVDLPLSEFTTMSYYIQRIRLAEICRSVVDLMPLSNIDLTAIDYREVIALDKKFETFFREMPAFLRTDEQSRLDNAHVAEQYTATKVQRYGIEMMAHVRRCKLHQPFLIRRSLAGHFTYSREASLQSARIVLQAEKLANQETGASISNTVNLTFLVHHVFLATIVLVMDLCFNKAESNDDPRKAEVRDACKILEKAGTRSILASKFINSLMDVLRAHKVRLYPSSGETTTRNKRREPVTALVPPAISAVMVPDLQVQQIADAWLPQENFQNHLSDFDEIWKDYVELGPNMDIPEWDNLFSDLDSKL